VKAFLSFGGSSLAVFVLASAVSVYLAAHAAGNSLQVLSVLSLVAAALMLAGFGVGAAVVRRVPSPARATVLGAGGAGVFIGVLSMAAAFNANPVDWWGLVLLPPALGAAASLATRRRDASENPDAATPIAFF
jgi:peptidoglycan/LPS O-acetylase OafA/YrhL